jgi:23S rRNA pseudouridine2457 synthase
VVWRELGCRSEIGENRVSPEPRKARALSSIVFFNKPYGVLSQFTPEGKWRALDEFIPIRNVYVAGRLDADSEGLLILTDDGKLQAKIADPRHKLEKTYWAQVEGVPDEAVLDRLRAGIKLSDFTAQPARVRLIDEPPRLWERDPPIRYRAAIPTAWLEIRISEGKNRQVRRMTAAIGYPTLRLIRAAIGAVGLAGLALGEWRQIAGSYKDLQGTFNE